MPVVTKEKAGNGYRTGGLKTVRALANKVTAKNAENTKSTGSGDLRKPGRDRNFLVRFGCGYCNKRRSVGDIQELCDRVLQVAYDIHVYHAHGHLEKVYENALAHRLRKAGLTVEQQRPIKVYDEDGTLIGEYFAT